MEALPIMSPREAAVAFAKLMQESENDPIQHLNFASPSTLGSSAMLREPACSPMEYDRLPLLPHELKSQACVSTPLVHVSRPLTAAQLVTAFACDVPFVEAILCMQDITRTALGRPARCALGE